MLVGARQEVERVRVSAIPTKADVEVMSNKRSACDPKRTDDSCDS